MVSSDLNVLDCIELRYSVGWPCNIVLSESCHNKYNLVLSFLLKLKLVVWSLHDACSRLNRIGERGLASINLRVDLSQEEATDK